MPVRPSVLLIATGRIESERLRGQLVDAGYSPEHVRSVEAGIARRARRHHLALVLDWRTLEVEYLGRDWRDAWHRLRTASGGVNTSLILFPGEPPTIPELNHPGVEVLGWSNSVSSEAFRVAIGGKEPADDSTAAKPASFHEWFGDSEPARQLVERAQSAAKWEGSVVISGPPGSGKRILAESICGWSSPRPGSFAVLSNLDDTFRRQPPTGPRSTLYIPHPELLQPPGQESLLRVLEAEPEFRLVAGVTGNPGTLWDRVKMGLFREDLYHRLQVFSLHVPALAERRSDLLPFAGRLLESICHRQAILVRRLLPECAIEITSRQWPGNVRQLRNALVAAVAHAGIRADLAASDLPDPITVEPEPGDFKSRVLAYERELITRALAETAGNRQQAARLLRIKRTTLIEKLRRFGWPEGEN